MNGRPLSFCVTACCRVRSDHYFHLEKAIVLVVELVGPIPVEVSEVAGPNPVAAIAEAAEAAEVGVIAPEPAGPSPAVMV